jgi:hypothetical protein
MQAAGRRRRKMVCREFGCLEGLDFPPTGKGRRGWSVRVGACLHGGGKGEYELLITRELARGGLKEHA